MSQNSSNEIASRDKLIAGLRNEIKMQTELIQAQKELIQTLENQNAQLHNLIKTALHPS